MRKEAPPNPLEIPRLIAQREAEKKKEYAERAKVDVREILNSEPPSKKKQRDDAADPDMLVSKD